MKNEKLLTLLYQELHSFTSIPCFSPNQNAVLIELEEYQCQNYYCMPNFIKALAFGHPHVKLWLPGGRDQLQIQYYTILLEFISLIHYAIHILKIWDFGY